MILNKEDYCLAQLGNPDSIPYEEYVKKNVMDRVQELLDDLYSAWSATEGAERVGIDYAIGSLEDKFPELFVEEEQ